MLGNRNLSLLLALAVALGGVASAAHGAAPVGIKVWLPGFLPYREAIIRDFQAEYPEVRLDLACKPPDGYQEALLGAIVTRTAPDLFLIEASGLGGLAGACEPLDKYLAGLKDLSVLDPDLLRMLAMGGKTLGLPVTGHPLALFIRGDWLAKLGLNLPGTWEEFAQAAEAFTRKDPDGNGRSDTYGLAERWPAADPATASRFLPWLYQAGGLAVQNQNGKWVPLFGQVAGGKALRLRRRLWDGGCIPPGAPANDAARNLALFTSGQAGMLVEDDRVVPAIRQALGAKAVAAPLPRDIRMGTVGEVFAFALWNGSQRKAAAISFVEWWLSRSTQEKLVLGWDGKPGGTSVNAGAQALGPRRDIDPASLLGEPLYAGFVQSFPQMAPEPYCPNYQALRLVIAGSVAAAMGPQTVEEALAAGMKEAAGLWGP